MGVNKFLYFLIEEAKTVRGGSNIRHRFLNIILLTGIVLFAGVVVEDVLINGFMRRTVASLGGLLFTSILYYFSRFKKIFMPIAILFFVFMLFAFMPILWNENGGMRGMLPFFFILYMVAIVFIFEGKVRFMFLVVAFVVAFVFSFLDFIHPSLSECNKKEYFYDINRSLAFFFVALSVAVLSSFALNRYTKEKQKAENLSKIDFLTGLFNRREGMERFSYIVSYLERNKRSISLIMMDLDDFKNINDSYGHICGDKVLKMVSNIIKSKIRQSDIAIRWGGEEILVVLPETVKEKAFLIAERIRRSIESIRFKCGSSEFHVTITGGVSVYNFGLSIEKNIDIADSALYKGKKSGKNRTVIAA